MVCVCCSTKAGLSFFANLRIALQRLRRIEPGSWFALARSSLLRNNIDPDAVILEFPHPEIPRAKIDTWMPDFHGRAVAIEFRYDWGAPGGTNSNKTQRAGAVFEDLRRLQLLRNHAVCHFEYVSTNDMDGYFKES